MDYSDMDTLTELFSRTIELGACRLWQGARVSGGYGSLKYKGRTVSAHRLAWQFANGSIPEGLELDHLCRVRHCINPDHLEAVTPQENVRRGHTGRHNKIKGIIYFTPLPDFAMLCR
jgi:hypothetical protein